MNLDALHPSPRRAGERRGAGVRALSDRILFCMRTFL